MKILNKLAECKQWIIRIVSSSTSIYKYGIPTLIDNTNEDPCDKCKYVAFSKQHRKICSFCERNLALNQYYR